MMRKIGFLLHFGRTWNSLGVILVVAWRNSRGCTVR